MTWNVLDWGLIAAGRLAESNVNKTYHHETKYLRLNPSFGEKTIRDAALNENDLCRPRHINSDKLWPADSGCHQMGSARCSSSMTHPSPKGPLFILTPWQHAVSLNTYSRWGRTPGRFAVASSVCCSSRSMLHDSHVGAVPAAMLTSGADFPVLSQVWAFEWEIVSETELMVKLLLDDGVELQNHVLSKYAHVYSRMNHECRSIKVGEMISQRLTDWRFFFIFLILCAVVSWAEFTALEHSESKSQEHFF